MRSLNEYIAAAALLVAFGSSLHAEADRGTLRVCADPNNLPFSNESRRGFREQARAVRGAKLGTTVSYVWWAQRRGFVSHTLKADTAT